MYARDVFEATDLHVAGAPVRVVTSGYPDLGREPAGGLLTTLRERHDEARRRLMCEPWGFGAMEGVVLSPAVRAQSAASLVFMDTEGYGPLCGRGLLAAASLLVRTGRAEPLSGAVRFDTALGQVEISVHDRGESGPAVGWAPPAARVVVPPVGSDDAAVAVCDDVEYAFVRSPCPIDLEPGHVETLRRSADEGRMRLLKDRGSDKTGRVVLMQAPFGPGDAWRLQPVDATGRLARAPGPRTLAAFAAVLAGRGALGAQAVSVAGPCGAALEVETTEHESGGGAAVSRVVATPYVVAWRRFFVDPNDRVAPFVVP